MNYASLKKNDIANGSGVRVSLFVSGCRHRCKNCFNASAWDFNFGELFTSEQEDEIIMALSYDYISGLSLLGGEPLEPENQAVLKDLVIRVKKELPDKNIWCYTGFAFEYILEEMQDNEVLRDLISHIDVLVDGKFVEELKDIKLKFRGSSNQRVIDIPLSLATNQIVLKAL
ncbi:MAG: anaerobic ribonucleoside-triphosphate reductase activating protein [Erysipelotrichaceae bacterium]